MYSGNNKFDSEELMLVTLYYMHCPVSTTDMTFPVLFGWNHTKVVKGIKLFMTWVFKNWSYLLSDNIDFWVSSFPQFSEKIREKLEADNCFFDELHIFGFIDNTVYATCAPGTGPTTPGPDSPRFHPYFQMAFYNGWKSIHGIKWQTVSLPNGMMLSIWGPVSVRHNDNFCLMHSNIQQKLVDAQTRLNLPIIYKVFGDSAYYADLCLRSYHRGDDNVLTDREKLENASMKKMRQSIEWDYGLVGNLWRKTDFKFGLRLREQPVNEVVTFAMLMTNFWVTLNGSITSEYFNCIPPTLEEFTLSGPKEANIEFFNGVYNYMDEVVDDTFFNYEDV
jgi:hypothetical protein